MKIDIWKHGKYIDTWSLVHFLSGALLSAFFYHIGYAFLVTALVSVGLLVLWEVFEWAVKIIEPSLNVITDIFVGFAGIMLSGYLFYFLSQPFEIYFYPTLGVTLILAVWGFTDFLKRGYR